MDAIFAGLGIAVGIVLFSWLGIFLLRGLIEEKWPWTHAEKCPCGTCYARRMKQAVERAEYDRQTEEIARAVREVSRS